MRHLLGHPGRWSACAVLLVMALAQHVGAQAPSLPNIVYILADDMGIGDVRSYTASSPVNTPNIDRIATAGMRFTDAHSSDSVCSPTRYSLMTGQYAWRTSYLQSGVVLPYGPPLIDPQQLTVAEMLKASGYSTGAFGKWHLGSTWALTSGTVANQNGSNVDYSQPITGGPIDNGFDTYFGVEGSPNYPPFAYVRDRYTVGADLVTHTSPTGNTLGNPSDVYNSPGPIAPGFESHDVLPTVTNQATAFIGAKANQANPFFAYIPLPAPHHPIAPPTFLQGTTGTNSYGDFIAGVDWAVGQVLNKLADPDGNPNTNDSVLNNTLVLFSADNGADSIFAFSTSPGSVNGVPLRGSKQQIYEGGHREPLLAQWPGHIQAGTVNNHLTELNDFMATAANIVGYNLPTDAARDSVNISSELLGTSTVASRTLGVERSTTGAYSIRQVDAAGNEWKLIFTPNDGGLSDTQKVDPKAITVDFTKLQLYNLTTDPGEQSNLLSGGGTLAMQQKTLQLRKVLQNVIAPRHIVNGQSTMLIDFGESSNTTSGAGWNNVSGGEGTQPVTTKALNDDAGGYTGIVLKTSWTLVGSNPGGVGSIGSNLWGDNPGENYPAAVSSYPVSALSDGFYSRNGTKLNISLEQLDAHATYDFLFYGACALSGPQGSLFTATGGNSGQTFITPIQANSTQVGTITGITPDALNKILITFEGRFADQSAGGSGYFNFMRIIEHLLDVPGDFNADRIVDAADFATWRNQYGLTGSGLSADGNHDGIVDGADYVIWRHAYLSSGAGAGSGLGQFQGVPEPNSCLLVAIGAAAMIATSARRRRTAF